MEESEGKDKEMASPSPQPELEKGKSVQPLEGAILAPQLCQISLFDTLTPDQLRSAQREDPLLEKIRSKASKTNGTYFRKDELLLRTPYHTLVGWGGGKLIIVSRAPRSKMLSLAHNTPVAGYFGRERTLATIRQWMDWPGLAKDAEKLCRSCSICQRACPAVVAKAPLHTLPICNQPFQRMAMDLAHCEERRPETSISW